ncbi:MAG: DAK2 domain-containing protein [Anaerolineales bacterium]|nr:DAK2 domain-containing protein [Anaerolineales bacterium]
MAQSSTHTQTPSRKDYFTSNPIDGNVFHSLVEAGLTWLKTNQQIVNALNVFPVPDGDTGTNMVLTMQSAVNESHIVKESHLGKVAGGIAQGALMGARGNSGVILSQIWRGISKALKEEEELSASAMAKMFAEARDTAYKGVVRPVEGTILTVIKDVANATENALVREITPIEMLEIAVSAAEKSVENTPNLLPILKEAGVVDSGGKGLYFILEGMLRWINGDDLETAEFQVQDLAKLNLDDAMETIEPGQDWELVIDFRPTVNLDLQRFYAKLETMGTSIQVGEGDGMYRLHIHVPDENRVKPWDYVHRLGTITNIAIENLLAQMEEISAKKSKAAYDLPPVNQGRIAVVAITPGKGIGHVFASLGANAIIEGGQTMNPSTQQIVEAFEDLPTDKVVILPNNKNIFMAAKAAAQVSVKDVRVIECRTIPQGLNAMMHLVPDGDLNDVAAEMTACLDEVETGEITVATRDVEIDGVEVKSGENIALHNGKLIVSSPSLEEACLSFFSSLNIDDYELITMFYGENITEAESKKIMEKIQEKYPDHEIELQYGGQPHYQFIFAVE